MGNAVWINADVTVGPQPTDGQLEELKQQGFQTIINFREDGEKDQPLSPEIEGEITKKLGMTYVHIPVSIETMAQTMELFRKQYSTVPHPIFAHCKLGQRAAAMVMMHVASEQGLTGNQSLEKAQELGLDLERPELKEIVRDYVNRKSLQ